MRYRVSQLFSGRQLPIILLMFLIFIIDMYSCFITPCYSDQKEYSSGIDIGTSDRENSRNVNRLDFDEGEFRPPLTIEKLCENIINDNLKAPDITKRAIDWLNELLETPGFYEKVPEKYPDWELVKKTKKYRNKVFSQLSKEKQSNIKRLNRLLLEKMYPELTPNIKKYVIVINKDGRLCEPESHGKKLIFPDKDKINLEIHKENDEECQYFDKIVARIKAWDKAIKDDRKQILIFIHGGLNSFENSYERARKLLYCDENKIPEYIYPIIINWESGIGTAYLEYVFKIRQGDTFYSGQKIAWAFASPFIILSDLGKGVLRLPYTTGYQIQNYTKTHPWRHELATEEINNWYVSDENKNKPEAIKMSGVYKEKPPVDLKRVLEDLPTIPKMPFKLMSNMIIDGGGKGAWETMVRRTQTMFNSPEEFTEDAQFRVSKDDRTKAKEEAKYRIIPRSTGALSKFMETLTSEFKKTKEIEINLIGHSMGTIVMNEILHRYSDLPFKHIVYMGAACSINDFRTNVVPYLEKHLETDFYSLSLHPFAEQRESHVRGLIPRGSLLEWLDNFLTSPNTTLDRRMGKWENIVRTSNVIPNEVRGRVTLKAFELCKGKNNSQNENKCKECHRNCSQKPPKNLGNPQGHGEFTEQNFWEEDFWEEKYWKEEQEK